MDDIEIRVTWKGKKAKMVLREEDDGINGYIAGKTRVLSLDPLFPTAQEIRTLLARR